MHETAEENEKCEIGLKRMKPQRPILRYHGGKWKLAPWIIEHFPAHRLYTEAFGGAASVLMQKARAFGEFYNDLDGEIVNVFRVLRNPTQARELEHLIALTPHSRQEWEEACLPSGDAVEQARRTITRSFMSYATDALSGENTGFRGGAKCLRERPAQSWATFHKCIEAFCSRLSGVTIENLAAVPFLQQYDSSEALHYVDPPYVPSTRAQGGRMHGYKFEMSEEQHRELSEVLHSLKGMVIVSGYSCELYDDELFADWWYVERKAFADGAEPRTEVLWLNDACAQKLKAQKQQLSLIA